MRSVNILPDLVFLTFLFHSLLFALASLSASSVPRSWPSCSVVSVIPPEILHFIPVPLPLRTSPLSSLHRSFSLGPLVFHSWSPSVSLPFSFLLFFVICRWEWRMCGRAAWGSWGLRVMTYTCTVTGHETFMEVQLETEEITKWQAYKVWLITWEWLNNDSKQASEANFFEPNCSDLILLAKIHP